MGNTTVRSVCGLCPHVLLLIDPSFLSREHLLTTVHLFCFFYGAAFRQVGQFSSFASAFLLTDTLTQVTSKLAAFPQGAGHTAMPYTLLSGFFSALSFTDAALQL